MTNGKTIARTPPRGSEEPPATPGLETPQPPSSVQEGTPTEPQPAPAEPQPPSVEFNHPLLKGRSPEEVERLFTMQENAMREQGTRLTQLTQEVDDIKKSQTTPPEPDPTAQEYFSDPVKTLRRELERQVEPLREEIKSTKAEFGAPLVRQKLSQEYEDWPQVEPYVDMLINQDPTADPNNEGLLRSLYFMAKGMMTHQGIDVSQPQPEPTAQPQVQPQPAAHPGTPQPQPMQMAPPQHRASSPPPPPPPAPVEPQLRDLTENEKRLAREYGMTAEEYIAWQETDMDEVAESEIGIPEEERNA